MFHIGSNKLDNSKQKVRISVSSNNYTVGSDGRIYNGKGSKGGLAPAQPKSVSSFILPPAPDVPKKKKDTENFSIPTLKAELRKIFNPKTERQAHGFHNEERIKSKYRLSDYVGKNYYVTKYDAQTSDGVPVSIKTEKIGTDIELADYFRNARIAEDFYMVVSFWKDKKTNISEEYHVKFPHAEWQKFFNHSVDAEINNLLKEAKNDGSYDEIWKEKIKKLKSKYGDNIIRLRPKRDHSKQIRMQCAISYNDFLELHEKYKTDDLRNHKNENKGYN